jgi:ubiquitin-conjugating enzyme E2 D/E
VLSIIQEKVNNPTPDDPFEPEIAAVMSGRMCFPSID